jgi:hypothetical protein
VRGRGLDKDRSGMDQPGRDAREWPIAPPRSSRNELSGVVHGPAVQAGSIDGGVHFSITQPTARLPVPAQLPPPPAYFTGRLQELARLDRIASQYDPARRLAVAVIVGPGGAGKTSLAAHWLDRITDRRLNRARGRGCRPAR